MKKVLLFTVVLTSSIAFTACDGEDESPVDDTNPNEDAESQEALSTMNDMVNQMEQLDYTMIDFDVLYADTEFEGKLKEEDHVIEAEFFDPFNGENEQRGQAAFQTLFPILENLKLDAGMTDEEAITTALEAFNIPDHFLKAELAVVFHDGTEKSYEIMRDITAMARTDENSEIQEAMSIMNSLASRIDELDFTVFDFNVYYADTEFEGKITKNGHIIESEFYDSFNGQSERGLASFQALFPIVQELQLDAEMTDEEAIAASLEAFNIPEDYLKAELEVTFHDGTERNYEILQNEL